MLRRTRSMLIAACLFFAPLRAIAESEGDYAHRTGMGSVVLVVALDTKKTILVGTGVVVGDGTILTAMNLTEPDRKVWVVPPQYDKDGLVPDLERYLGAELREEGMCEVAARDMTRNLALLRRKLPRPGQRPVRLARRIESGQEVSMLGAEDSGDSLWRYSRCHVRRRGTVTIKRPDGLLISFKGMVMDRRIRLMHMGAPVLNRSGELVGIIVGRVVADKEAIGIDADEIREFLDAARAAAPVVPAPLAPTIDGQPRLDDRE